MDKQFNEILPDIAYKIAKNYTNSDLLLGNSEKSLPVRKIIIEILDDLRKLLFPIYFSTEQVNTNNASYYTGQKLSNLHVKIKKQITLALEYNENTSFSDSNIALSTHAENICCEFFKKLPQIQSLLLLDAQAGYDGDPSASNREQIIFSYPGFYAIFVYRLAHELYNLNVPFIPRIMTEHAHSKTGIDINAGATIGKYFFMDHGTGIVIGETTIIGDYVKLYQGVTLGALSTRGGQHLAGVKRHPTIEDRVTIYSNATILGGETVIGKDSIIGGGAFITSSIPEKTRVSVTPPDLSIKNEIKHNSSATNYVYEI